MQKQHLNSWINQQLSNPTEMEEACQDYDFPNGVDFGGPDEDNTGAGQCPQGQKVSYHPILDGTFICVDAPITSADHSCIGTPCDRTGSYLPPNSPPPLLSQVPFQTTTVPMRVWPLSSLLKFCTIMNRCLPPRSMNYWPLWLQYTTMICHSIRCESKCGFGLE